MQIRARPRRTTRRTRPVEPGGQTLTVRSDEVPPTADAFERYQRIDRYVVLEALGHGGM